MVQFPGETTIHCFRDWASTVAALTARGLDPSAADVREQNARDGSMRDMSGSVSERGSRMSSVHGGMGVTGAASNTGVVVPPPHLHGEKSVHSHRYTPLVPHGEGSMSSLTRTRHCSTDMEVDDQTVVDSVSTAPISSRGHDCVFALSLCTFHAPHTIEHRHIAHCSLSIPPCRTDHARSRGALQVDLRVFHQPFGDLESKPPSILPRRVSLQVRKTHRYVRAPSVCPSPVIPPRRGTSSMIIAHCPPLCPSRRHQSATTPRALHSSSGGQTLFIVENRAGVVSLAKSHRLRKFERPPPPPPKPPEKRLKIMEMPNVGRDYIFNERQPNWTHVSRH